MTGEFRQGPMPQAFGVEFGGVIVGLSDTGRGWSIGDEVLGSGGGFTHATVIDVPIANLVARPKNVDAVVAGTIAGVAQTAMADRAPWAELLRHVFDSDALRCPHCGGRLVHTPVRVGVGQTPLPSRIRQLAGRERRTSSIWRPPPSNRDTGC